MKILFIVIYIVNMEVVYTIICLKLMNNIQRIHSLDKTVVVVTSDQLCLEEEKRIILTQDRTCILNSAPNNVPTLHVLKKLMQHKDRMIKEIKQSQFVVLKIQLTLNVLCQEMFKKKFNNIMKVCFKNKMNFLKNMEQSYQSQKICLMFPQILMEEIEEL